jgi:hypothetical protein
MGINVQGEVHTTDDRKIMHGIGNNKHTKYKNPSNILIDCLNAPSRLSFQPLLPRVGWPIELNIWD